MTPYVTITEGNNYFVEQLNNDAWYDANSSRQLRALNTSTRLINRLNFAGSKTDSEQENEFPRNDETDIPEAIKIACLEITYSLLDGRDPEFESEQAHHTNISLGSTRINKDVDNVPMHILHNIPSHTAWSYLKPYLVDPFEIQVVRIG
jgi:hypothetical protein